MTTHLPSVDWTQRADLAKLVAALGAGTIRWVGGAVRDTLLDHPVNDIDAATLHQPDAVIALLGRAGIRTVPTGIAHGTVTAVLAEGSVEITTLRRDVSTDGRRTTIEFSDDWREDAGRRDFTINALYADPATLEIFDYFGGLDDLAARRVRFIGDPRERIREDHLRILRYYRFQARFGSELDAAAEEACAELAPMLKGLSRERVGWELLALLRVFDPRETLWRMHMHGVLAIVLPEVLPEGLYTIAALNDAEDRHCIAPDAIRRLAALLPTEPTVADQVAARLRLSRAQRKRLVRLADRAHPASDPRALAYREGREAARDLLLLAGDDSGIYALADWDVPAFPLKGGDIVTRGVSAGPEVARVLQAVEAQWIAEGFPSAERVEQLLDQYLG